MNVYVDGVMAVNFLVDFLLMLGTNRLAGFPDSKKRLAAAAMLGGIYGGVCLLPDFRFLGNLLWRTVMLMLMGYIAFGWDRSGLRRCGLFLMLSMALGGIAVSIGRDDVMGLLAAAALLLLMSRLSFPAEGQRYAVLRITNGSRTVELLALRDTGNGLRDPVTGQQALVISASAACRLTGLTQQQLRSPLETMVSGAVPGLRLLPFRTVGQGSGMMLAAVFEDVVLNGRKQSALVAFSPENFNQNGTFQALTGGALSC